MKRICTWDWFPSSWQIIIWFGMNWRTRVHVFPPRYRRQRALSRVMDSQTLSNKWKPNRVTYADSTSYFAAIRHHRIHRPRKNKRFVLWRGLMTTIVEIDTTCRPALVGPASLSLFLSLSLSLSLFPRHNRRRGCLQVRHSNSNATSSRYTEYSCIIAIKLLLGDGSTYTQK